MEAVSSEWLVQGIREHGHREVIYCPRKEKVVSTVMSMIRPGDVVLTLGAGDIYKAGEEILKKLKSKSKKAG